MSTVLITEYYVRYSKPPSSSSSDTTLSKYSSRNFVTQKEAEEFKKSMISQGAVEAEVCKFEFYYEKD